MRGDELYQAGYRLERGGSVADLPEIEHLYRRSAAAGSAAAMARLGRLLEGRTRAEFEGHWPGRAVGNLAEAAEWYRRGAERGDPHAAFSLGRLYSEKLGDWTKAEPWYRRAARGGHDEARRRLAGGPHGEPWPSRENRPDGGWAVLAAVVGLAVLLALVAFVATTG